MQTLESKSSCSWLPPKISEAQLYSMMPGVPEDLGKNHLRKRFRSRQSLFTPGHRTFTDITFLRVELDIEFSKPNKYFCEENPESL